MELSNADKLRAQAAALDRVPFPAGPLTTTDLMQVADYIEHEVARLKGMPNVKIVVTLYGEEDALRVARALRRMTLMGMT